MKGLFETDMGNCNSSKDSHLLFCFPSQYLLSAQEKQ